MLLGVIFIIATFGKKVSAPKDRIGFKGALYLSNFKTIGYFTTWLCDLQVM